MINGPGYDVDVVVNGAEAVPAAVEHSYDAIPVDCRLPELSGYRAPTPSVRAE